MEINHDKGLLENNQLVKAGLANEVAGKICFEGNLKLHEQSLVKKIADHLEENYKMYQYKKDNGVVYGKEDLFFWTNRDDFLYFDVTVKADTVEKHNQIVDSIVKYVEDNYSNTQINVRLQYTYRKDWNKINEFLNQDFDINDLPIKTLQILHSEINYVGTKFSKESIEKLYELSNMYLDQFVDKKVMWKGMKGTIRKFEENRFGFFKLRARKNYYTINLGSSNSLEIA